jgi:hypothetical protein
MAPNQRDSDRSHVGAYVPSEYKRWLNFAARRRGVSVSRILEELILHGMSVDPQWKRSDENKNQKPNHP